MQPLNGWVESAVPSVKRFFRIALVPHPTWRGDRLLTPRPQSVVSTESLEVSSRLHRLHAVPNPTAKEDSKCLRKFLHAHHSEYRLALLDAKAYETLLRVTSLLPAVREDSADSSSNSSSRCD